MPYQFCHLKHPRACTGSKQRRHGRAAERRLKQIGSSECDTHTHTHAAESYYVISINRAAVWVSRARARSPAPLWRCFPPIRGRARTHALAVWAHECPTTTTLCVRPQKRSYTVGSGARVRWFRVDSFAADDGGGNGSGGVGGYVRTALTGGHNYGAACMCVCALRVGGHLMEIDKNTPFPSRLPTRCRK